MLAVFRGDSYHLVDSWRLREGGGGGVGEGGGGSGHGGGGGGGERSRLSLVKLMATKSKPPVAFAAIVHSQAQFIGYVPSPPFESSAMIRA